MTKRLLLCLAVLLIAGCTDFPGVADPSSLKKCEYTQRDLTTPWSERLYWCEVRD